MAQVNINFRDLRGHKFDEIRERLIHYLTPPKGQKIHPITHRELSKVRDLIQNQRDYEVRFNMDHSYAGNVAKDLGLFPNVDPEQLRERYRVARPLGGTFSHDISIFGKVRRDRRLPVNYPHSERRCRTISN